MSYEPCTRCKRHCWDGQCKCVRFRCGVPWKDQIDRHSLHVVWATDAESAAERYAELYDSDGDYTIIRRGRGEVWVLDESDVQTKWEIEAESVPEYRAYEKRSQSETGAGPCQD